MNKFLKRTLALAAAASLALSLAACGGGGSSSSSSAAEDIVIKVGASPAPHAAILEVAKPILAEQGITLEIVEFTDYVLPNLSLEDGSLDANFFQHVPYLDWFNTEHGTDLVVVGGVHYEPMGIYPGKTLTLTELAEGAIIGIPNDRSNGARALLLLQELGYITLAEDAGLDAAVTDITENPLNLEIVELAAEQLPLSLPDLDFAVINGNYAVSAGIQATVLAAEAADGDGATYYQNVLVIRAEDADSEVIAKLYAALTGPEVKEYIETTYPDKSVIPVF